MIDTHSIALTTIVKEFDLQVVHAATDFDSVRITVEDISRPGIQLSGYFDHFDAVRVQIIGLVENNYLQTLGAERKKQIYTQLLSYEIPCLVYTTNIEPDAELVAKYEVQYQKFAKIYPTVKGLFPEIA